jgi:hypothetical protein
MGRLVYPPEMVVTEILVPLTGQYVYSLIALSTVPKGVAYRFHSNVDLALLGEETLHFIEI